MGASTILNRLSTLVNVGYGEELDPRSGYTSSETWTKPNSETWARPNSETWVKPNLRNTIQEEYIDEEIGTLNRKGQKFLSNLYGNNEEFRDEVTNFIRDKMELDLEVILDRRYKTNMLDMMGKKYLVEYITSKDNTKDIIEILARYYLESVKLLNEVVWLTTSEARFIFADFTPS